MFKRKHYKLTDKKSSDKGLFPRHCLCARRNDYLWNLAVIPGAWNGRYDCGCNGKQRFCTFLYRTFAGVGSLKDEMCFIPFPGLERLEMRFYGLQFWYLL